jgi:hypothetical protein
MRQFNDEQWQHLQQKLCESARELFWSEHDKDTYECPVCGGDGPFDVHHRDRDRMNMHMYNLIGVCRRCHQWEHRASARRSSLQRWKDGFRAELLCDDDGSEVGEGGGELYQASYGLSEMKQTEIAEFSGGTA